MDAFQDQVHIDLVTIELSQLINAGKWRQARHKAAQAVKDSSLNQSAAIWVKYAQIEFLTCRDDPLRALHAGVRAERCADYTDIMRGDFTRDYALWFMRHGEPENAERYLRNAEVCYEGDLSRFASLITARARLLFRQGTHSAAFREHMAADSFWHILNSDTDRQLRIDNRFYMLLAAVSCGEQNVARHLLREVVRFHPDQKRHLMAVAAWCGGPPVAKVVGARV